MIAHLTFPRKRRTEQVAGRRRRPRAPRSQIRRPWTSPAGTSGASSGPSVGPSR